MKAGPVNDIHHAVIEYVAPRVDNTLEEVRELRKDVRELRQEIANLRNDVSIGKCRRPRGEN